MNPSSFGRLVRPDPSRWEILRVGLDPEAQTPPVFVVSKA